MLCRLATLIIILFFAMPARADTITLAADIWCPYNCAADDKNQGYVLEIARAVFEKAGHKVDYKILDWTQSVARARAGAFSGIIGASFNDAPDFIFPEQPAGTQNDSLLTRSDDPFTYTTIESLQGHVLGTIDGYAYDAVFNTYIEKYKDDKTRISMAKGDDALATNIKALVTGKLDVVLEDKNVLSYQAKKLAVETKTKIQELKGKKRSIYIAFSPQDPTKAKAYAKIFDEGIMALRASGKLKEILAKYGLADWQSK